MATKGQTNGKAATRTTKASPVSRTGGRDGRHVATGTTAAEASTGARSAAAKLRSVGTNSRTASTSKPRPADKPKAAPADKRATASAPKSTSQEVIAARRNIAFQTTKPVHRQEPIRWIHHPYVVNLVEGLLVLAVLALVTRDWRVVAAGAVMYAVGAYTWFQGRKEVA